MNPRSGRSTKIKSESPNVVRSKKRKGDYGFELEETRIGRVTMGVELVRLPRNPNVDDILKKYLDYRTKKDGMIAESVGEILKGLRGYFDKALSAMLLYKRERRQYQHAVADNASPSTIYGAEHLLRLFVKLPELLASVNMEEETLSILMQKLHDLLKFLKRNQSSFFLSTYASSKQYEDIDQE